MTDNHGFDAPSVSSTDVDRMRSDFARATLAALDAVLNIEDSEDSFATLFERFETVFGHDNAMVLEEQGDKLVHCIASVPQTLIGKRWAAGDLFGTIVGGRVLAADPIENFAGRQSIPPDLVAPGQPALFLPIGVAGRPAVLVLLRARHGEAFSEAHVAVARQCAVVALAALAARNCDRFGAEVQRLNVLADELRHSEQQAQQDRDLVKGILDQLPIGVTVQDHDGRFVLVNAVAAGNMQTPGEALVGASPADFLADDEAAQRRRWEIGLIESGELSTAEENLSGPAGDRTWLTLHKPVQIVDRKLLLSTSLDITDRKHAENELARRAYFDELTGLPNRTLVEHQVEEALKRQEKDNRFALAFIDLDNFKHINDYYSHAIGDALLIKVAERIGKRLRETDMLARISGDEFLLLIDPVPSDDQVKTVIDNVLDDLKQPFHIESFEVFTSASLGVSIYPDHGTSYEGLRRNADNAMYRAKSGVKGDAVYFDMTMGRTITARMELEQRLRLAIRDHKFCCAFQPKVDIHSQDVVGFETLVRWRDDDGEIQPPSTFIDLAIELGLIDPITHFVLNDAIKSIERLDQAFEPGTTISINIAAKQAGDVKFMLSLIDIIEASRYAERIMLELTEDAFVAKSQFQVHVLPMLRELGVRVSIDDFGTGYSSLSVLADITADELKVDRSFITAIHQRPRSQGVLRAIESIGHALGLTIVAEGIETFEELAYLQAATRIRYAQGYYFSKPFYIDTLKDARGLTPDAREVKPARGEFEGRSYASLGRSAERAAQRD